MPAQPLKRNKGNDSKEEGGWLVPKWVIFRNAMRHEEGGEQDWRNGRIGEEDLRNERIGLASNSSDPFIPPILLFPSDLRAFYLYRRSDQCLRSSGGLRDEVGRRRGSKLEQEGSYQGCRNGHENQHGECRVVQQASAVAQ